MRYKLFRLSEAFSINFPRMALRQLFLRNKPLEGRGSPRGNGKPFAQFRVADRFYFALRIDGPPQVVHRVG